MIGSMNRMDQDLKEFVISLLQTFKNIILDKGCLQY